MSAPKKTDIPFIDCTDTDELFLKTLNHINLALNTEPHEPEMYMNLMNAAKFRPGKCDDIEKAKGIACHGFSPSPSEITIDKDIFKDIELTKTNKRMQDLLDSNKFSPDEKDFIKKFKNYKSFQDLIDTASLGGSSNSAQDIVKQAKKREEVLRNISIAFITNNDAFIKPDNKQNIDSVLKTYDFLMLGLKKDMLCSQGFKSEAKTPIKNFITQSWIATKDDIFSSEKKKREKFRKEVEKLAAGFWLRYCLPKVMDNEFQKMVIIEQNKNSSATNSSIKQILKLDINPDLKLYAIRHKNNQEFIHASASLKSDDNIKKFLRGAYMMEHALNNQGFKQLGKNADLNAFQNTLLSQFMSARFYKAKEYLENKEKAYKYANITGKIGTIASIGISSLIGSIDGHGGHTNHDGGSADGYTPSPDDMGISMDNTGFNAGYDVPDPDSDDSSAGSSHHGLDHDYVDPSAGGHVNFTAQTFTKADAQSMDTFTQYLFNHKDKIVESFGSNAVGPLAVNAIGVYENIQKKSKNGEKPGKKEYAKEIFKAALKTVLEAGVFTSIQSVTDYHYYEKGQNELIKMQKEFNPNKQPIIYDNGYVDTTSLFNAFTSHIKYEYPTKAPDYSDKSQRIASALASATVAIIYQWAGRLNKPKNKEELKIQTEEYVKNGDKIIQDLYDTDQITHEEKVKLKSLYSKLKNSRARSEELTFEFNKSLNDIVNKS